MEALDTQAMRLLRLFGNTTSKKVTPSVGAEQEYFLVDSEKFLQRKDLIYTGRTLFGAMPPKGQEMDDHYFGTIRQRIASFMKDVNEELWKVGVTAKTQHIDAIVCYQRPVIMFSRSIHPCKRFLMEQTFHSVPACHPFQSLHLNFDNTVTAACLTSSALYIKAEYDGGGSTDFF